ncbi:leucine zipper domain-containing protein [Streptomyces longispororuber]
MERYRAEGLAGLIDESRRPRVSPPYARGDDRPYGLNLGRAPGE